MKKIAIVGATGLVGRTFLKVLEEYKFEGVEYKLFSSKRSAGTEIDFLGKPHIIHELTETSFDEGFDFALFSAGGEVSRIYAKIAKDKNCVVIDNSSTWRMNKEVPLVVPEVNSYKIKEHNGIIANPNCSTIQAVVVLKPLHDKYKIKRIVYSTYQAVSGAGSAGISDLQDTLKGLPHKKFQYKIADNCLPHIDVFLENGYTKEEMKMIEETKKILDDDSLKITATTVRVPVTSGHSESINIEFYNKFELDEVINILENSKGIIVKDDIKNNVYPIASESVGKNEVFVGRIRRDESIDNGLNLWVVADNIRKGAATNAVQILAEFLK